MACALPLRIFLRTSPQMFHDNSRPHHHLVVHGGVSVVSAAPLTYFGSHSLSDSICSGDGFRMCYAEVARYQLELSLRSDQRHRLYHITPNHDHRSCDDKWYHLQHLVFHTPGCRIRAFVLPLKHCRLAYCRRFPCETDRGAIEVHLHLVAVLSDIHWCLCHFGYRDDKRELK